MIRSKLPPILAAAALVLLTFLFFWKILLTNLILVGVDTFLYFYPYKAYVSEALRQGRLPLWNPHLFMGAPLLANSQVGLFYPPNWLFIWLDPPRQVAWSIGLHIALAGLFMLAYARGSLALRWAGSLAAAIIFSLGGYLGAQVEHINQLNAAVWLPLLFLLYDLALAAQPRQRWARLLGLALVVAMTLLAGHAQTVFISLFGLGLYGMWRALAGQSLPRASLASLGPALRRSLGSVWSHLWPLAVASVLALALAAVQLLPTAQLTALSIRRGGLSFREVVSFSLRPTVLHFSLLPPFGLDLSQTLGPAFGEWVAYVGISGLGLALLGLLQALRRPAGRGFVFLAGVGLGLSLGMFSGPLYLALYYLVPGFDLFRVPARWLLLYAFAVAVLAGFGFDLLLSPANLRSRLTSAWSWLGTYWWRRVILLGLPLAGLLALIAWKTPPILTLLSWAVMLMVLAGLVAAGVRAGPPLQREGDTSTTSIATVDYDNASNTRRQGQSDVSASPQFAQPGFMKVKKLIRVEGHPHARRIFYPIIFLKPIKPGLLGLVLIVVLITELFLARQTLSYNHPTAPQAYHSLRSAIAYLLAADPPRVEPGPPGRFLSLSGITYDPGDLADLEQIYGDFLSPRGLYQLIVATKQKEVLYFNLPLVYGLHSVDGYDGGILPLDRFVTMQALFLPPDDLSIDGRLREKLRFVPEGRLLSLLNARWIITDKQFDVWIDDIFYDLQFPARLDPDQTIATRELPSFPATALGLVSHLEGAADLPAGTPVAELVVTFAGGTTERFLLVAGRDTAEGNYPPGGAAHPQATIGVAWPYEAQGVDYVTVLVLPEQRPAIEQLALTALLPEGRFVLRGLSLIHQPTRTSRSVILTTEGRYHQVHSGDVKIYENLAVLPRTFVVHQAQVVENEAEAIAALRQADFNPAETVVRLAQGEEVGGLIVIGQPSSQDRVEFVSYEPERIELNVSLASPAWLVLSDSYYPGWQATLDGQPVDIIPANLMFRSVAVPAGEHRVVFRFQPRSVGIGALISVVALLAVVGGFIIANRKIALSPQ